MQFSMCFISLVFQDNETLEISKLAHILFVHISNITSQKHSLTGHLLVSRHLMDLSICISAERRKEWDRRMWRHWNTVTSWRLHKFVSKHTNASHKKYMSMRATFFTQKQIFELLRYIIRNKKMCMCVFVYVNVYVYVW